jgi:hypothetical protein
MTRRIPVNSEQITLDDIWQHYDALRGTVVREAEETRQSLGRGTAPRNPQLLGMGIEEMDAYFEAILEEIDAQASLFLLAATEATLRVDFLARVYERRKDPVSRTFRDVYKRRRQHTKTKVRLEEDILDTWGQEWPESKSHASRLKGALEYRHWLAHGRWWPPKLGQRYDPSGLVQIITGFLAKIGVAYQ